MVAVTSLDGKLTWGDDPDIHKWTSKDDKRHFAKMRESHNLIVMGRGTYEAIKPVKPIPGKLRVVLTRKPEVFRNEAAAGSLEFSSESPARLVARLEKNGFGEMLVVGGGEINAAFLEADLIDEIYLTIEPYVFGVGTDFAAGANLNKKLELMDTSKLNDKGTILLHYRVKKDT